MSHAQENIRSIVHLDADAFFASVEQAADPRLRAKPVAVGGESRGIIASASYEARKFGVYTPMPTVQARRLCPQLIVVPGDFEKYEQFSRWMFSYVYDFTPDVEISSIDEGYFDLSGARKSPLEIARIIRTAIGDSLKISVSEGIGASKLVSQIASKLNKPAAFCSVPFGGETAFLDPLPNFWLPGIGPRNAARLNAAGLARIGQIAGTPLDLLELLLGSSAVTVRDFARGRDDRPLLTSREPAKSYSQQETFASDITDEERLVAVLQRMADQLMAKVRGDGKSIRTITLKVRYNDMEEDQVSESLSEPTDLESDLYPRLRPWLRRAWKRRVSLRMLSLRLSNVYHIPARLHLPIDRASEGHLARRRLAEAVDALRREHGPDVLLRGHDFLLREAPAPYAGSPALQIALPSSRRDPLPRQPSRFHIPVPAPPAARPQPLGSVLHMQSCYSFLNSTLSIPALVALGARHGAEAMALTDDWNLHGAVEFTQAARAAGIRPILGARVRLEGGPLWLYAASAEGYANLCGLLSLADSREHFNTPGALQASHLEDRTEGLIGVSPDLRAAPFFPGRFYQAVGRRDLRGFSGHPRLLVLPVHYAAPEDRWKYDVVQSIRTRTLLRQEHPEKRLRGACHFRPPAELDALWSAHPELLRNARELMDRCAFEIPFGRPQFPEFRTPDGTPPAAFLRRLVLEGLKRRYPGRHRPLQAQVEEELSIIAAVGYEEYFLVVWDILQLCRSRGIDWITRGSAADSLVCYCLGISDVCPIRFDLFFRRFLNQERMQLNKLPDIDIDFPHDRKDDVIDLIFERHGTAHTAVVGGFSTYKARSAIGDVGKVLGLSERQVRRFTERIPHVGMPGVEQAMEERHECRDLPLEEEPYRSALRMARFLDGFPRCPKMHPCGVVLSRGPMGRLTPTFRSHKGYPTTHFDMESVEAIGLVKMDILAQGGLAVMRDTLRSLRRRSIEVDLQTLRARALEPAAATALPASPDPAEPWSDPEVWDLISRGDARAVHHIESPAMISLCRMCQVRDIDGLVAIVSVIRPGAANENNKLRFSRRYQGLEPVAYPDPSLERCLRSTFGLVVYEEHILQICEAFAGLSPGRADVLRRALGKEKQDVIETIRGEFFDSARKRGHAAQAIESVWNLVAGFTGYAFCKAHSTAYGVEAYQSAWLKRYFPAEFMAAVLTNAKGFYHPLVYLLECHRLGIPILPPWINQPGPEFAVESGSIRVPVTRIKGLSERTIGRIVEERARGAFESLSDFYRRAVPLPEEMESMIRVGAFDGFGTSRTGQFWESQLFYRAFGASNDAAQGWLLPPPGLERLPEVPLEEPGRRQRLEWEMELLEFTVSGHPLELHEDIAWETYCPVAQLKEHVGTQVVTCGLIIEERMHHQVTGEPMKFLALADWTGMVESELFAATYRTYGLATVRYPVLEVTATVEPFENGRGFSLRVHRAGRPRRRR